ncbi:MAG TPA: ABC transporter permease, partial [Candidatus Limnocylindria bacterium]|nr:ABC transporter permease [Candidatus Limnocylindria bacterium]
MKLLRAIGARLASLFERNRRNQEMDLEILSHIEMQTRDNIAAGMSGEDARTAAFRQFGRMEAIKETCRDQRRIAWLENFLQDTRFAVRMLGKKPGFTAVAVATLALCLGANLAIFAVTNSILLRSLPFPQAGRLVALYNSYPRAGVDRDGSSVACYYERRQAIPAFQSLSIYRPDSAIVGETGATEREEVLRVSPEFFATLGIQLPHGRTFIEEETTYGSDHVAIITDAYWKQHFQGASNVLGRTLRMDGYPKTIIAILPPGYRFLSHRAQLYLPLSSNASQRTAIERHSGSGTEMIGRLRPAATLAEATAQVATHNAALADTYPRAKMIAEAGFHTVLLSLHGDHVKSVQPVLFSLQAAALLLLLIGGANLANLYLIRVTDRAREFGIRRSLGASRPRMVSQIVTETLLTTLAGGILGLGVAAMGLRLLGTLGVRQLPLGGEVVFDTPLAIIGLLLAVLAGLLISIPVVWFGLRGDPSRSLRSEARGATANTASQRL